MEKTMQILDQIITEGEKAYKTGKSQKEFMLTLNAYSEGNIIGQHLIALAYTLSFALDKYASWRGLIGLPYVNNATQSIVDNGIPKTEAVNLVIHTVAVKVCKIKVKPEYYLTDGDIQIAYTLAKESAKKKIKAYKNMYKAYSNMYADQFEIES